MHTALEAGEQAGRAYRLSFGTMLNLSHEAYKFRQWLKESGRVSFRYGEHLDFSRAYRAALDPSREHAEERSTTVVYEAETVENVIAVPPDVKVHTTDLVCMVCCMTIPAGTPCIVRAMQVRYSRFVFALHRAGCWTAFMQRCTYKED